MKNRLFLCGLAVLLAVATPAWAGDIAPGLQKIMDQTPAGKEIGVLVFLNEQVDLAALDASLTASKASFGERHEVVVSTLRQIARESQGAFLDAVDAMATDGGVHVSNTFWISNVVSIKATAPMIEKLAERPDVARIYYNYEIELITPTEVGEESSRGLREPTNSLNAIRAPDAWALGYDGTGILVANMDTGVAGNHEALADRWAGLRPEYAGHPEWAWFDPYAGQNDFPYDNHGHGTHTMGTVCGGAPGQDIGVAPGAHWMASAPIDRGGGISGTVEDAIESFEWMVDPDGNPATSWDVPLVCSNSWGLVTGHGYDPCDDLFWSYLDNCEAAGTVILFSAGNEGSSGLRRPADRATDAYRTCAVASVDAENYEYPWPISSFSSRGPTYCTPDGSAAIKPDIAAPGSDVYSATPSGGYTTMSGTSMASPHVNGVVALIRQACPDLTVEEVKQVLYDTAVDLGEPGEDNTFGWGNVDAYEAVLLALELCIDSEGRLDVDSPKYACEDEVLFIVRDLDLNLNPAVAETVDIEVVSESEPTGETVTCVETGPDTSRFEATLPISGTDGAGILLVADGNTIVGTYYDEDNGMGEPATVTVEAAVDCTPPVISDVNVIEVEPRRAEIGFTTDEPVYGIVHWGLSCDELDNMATGPGYTTEPTVRLTGLQDNTTYFYMVEAVDEAGNIGSDPTCYNFTTPEVPDFFTEQFESGFDLDGLKLILEPAGGVDFYVGCVEEIYELPTDPSGGTTLSLSDDDNELVNLSDSVHLYDVAYDSFYVGSNGYITFNSGDTDYTESLDDHFGQPRISGLFDDLNPNSGGTISYRVLEDRVAVTWDAVPEYGTSNSNTFQIEMFFDGLITISHVGIASSDNIVGLSEGDGLDPDYYPSDLSNMGSCGPRPPRASNAEVGTPVGEEVEIELIAVDDGLPDPPAALTYVVTSLPEHGDLLEPGVGEIDSVPWILQGNVVVYDPSPFYQGPDSFMFIADDGGVPPEGGESNVGVVSITVGGPQVIYDFPMDEDPGWDVEGEWAFGQPTGGGSHNFDPTSGYTGDNVYGYNLNGDYANNIPEYALTTTALDLSDASDTELRFWRWLGVESATWDHASLLLSVDGTNWTTLWDHSGGSISESSWSEHVFDISEIADNQPMVYIRWVMGTTDSSVTYPGWNIDDVQIWGVVPLEALVGDMNCDGVVNNFDIDPFVMALTDPAGYEAMYPDCEIDLGDINGDGAVNNFDIDPFVELLTN